MSPQELIEMAQKLVADDKGLLAMDESNPTCNRRFAKVGIPQTEEARRAWRELIVTTPGLGESISGAILYDETIRQQTRDGTPFAKALPASRLIPGRRRWPVIPERKSPKASTDCAAGWRNTLRWARVLQSGAR
jgi:fructose-bisphosphate aldolase class I